MQDLTTQVNTVLEAIEDKLKTQSRLIVSISGAPASGKSTLSTELARRLSLKKLSNTIVPMDGFHLDNRILDARGLRPRKGSPETFDAEGFIALIKRIKAGETVYVPEFDRARDISINAVQEVTAETQVVIIEGNYLMFDEAPWRSLADEWDLSICWSVPTRELRARLLQRWLSLNHSSTNAQRRVEQNDLPNAERVIAKQIECDIILKPFGD